MSAGISLVLSTRNPHKVREFARLLRPFGIAVEPLPDEVTLPPEDGDTFAENALPKARTAAAHTGRAAIADDSGIEAEALGGAPGVRSARYSGENATDEANLEKLLREAPAGSGLRYVCALAYVDPVAGIEELFFGECVGTLAAEPRGSGGFGYDPAFVPVDGAHARSDDGAHARSDDGAHARSDHGRTMAELSDEEKDEISHRGRAARALARRLLDR